MNIAIIAAVVNLVGQSLIWHPAFPSECRRSDGTIVVDFQAQSQSVRESCGWYNLIDNPPDVSSNETARIVGYTRVTEGYRRDYEVTPVDPPEPPGPTALYYTVDLLAAIGEVVGSERYDGIKGALSETRINGAPVWDMLISGMYIPADDPRLDQIKAALVGAGLLTADEFEHILALARSDEPVAAESESDAAPTAS